MQSTFYAETPSELASRDTLLSMSGLDFMRAMLAGTLPHPPIGKGLNYRLHSVEEGRVAFRGAPQFRHSNPMGAIHGGWYGTLLDSAMGCAVMTRVPKGSVYTTLEYKINIVRPIPIGTEVLADSATSHSGRSTCVAEGTIRGADDGRLYATGSTTCIIMAVNGPHHAS